MSALGQKQTSRPEISMSALLPKADIAGGQLDVRFVPTADMNESVLRKRTGLINAVKCSDRIWSEAVIAGLGKLAEQSLRLF